MLYLYLKRIMDILLGITSLVILSPFLLFVIITLMVTGEREIFYLQERIGHKNNKFKIIKFATMVKNSSKMGTGSLTLRDDPRVLPFGKILRKTKINELPQIVNVLIGNMSIVGPRPQMQIDFDKFPQSLRDKIYLSKPGITGIGSVFFRDEEKWISEYEGDKHEFYKNIIAPYKTDLELWYLREKSVLVDLKIIIITAFVIIFPIKDPINLFFKSLPKPPENLKRLER